MTVGSGGGCGVVVVAAAAAATGAAGAGAGASEIALDWAADFHPRRTCAPLRFAIGANDDN